MRNALSTEMDQFNCLQIIYHFSYTSIFDTPIWGRGGGIGSVDPFRIKFQAFPGYSGIYENFHYIFRNFRSFQKKSASKSKNRNQQTPPRQPQPRKTIK